MRRRRQSLQVNTFPFLAVLLCAMGSLILLLLVLDRRARVVARVKAVHAAELALAENTATAAARRAEWERRRQMLHNQLASEDQSVLSDVHTARKRIETTTVAIGGERSRVGALSKEIEREKSWLVHEANEVNEKRRATTQLATKAAISRTELAELTAQLQQMERTLSELKEVRKRQQQMHSLVPYQGKRGDNRRPIYVECTVTGVIFHPEALAFQGTKFTSQEIRAEIERRISANQRASASTDSKPEDSVYLLMLIRPDGITAYYKTLAALAGMSVDFGYEFIDRDWVLDFFEGGSNLQSWTQTGHQDKLLDAPGSTKVVHGIHAFPANDSRSLGEPSSVSRRVAASDSSTGATQTGAKVSASGAPSPMAGRANPYPTGNGAPFIPAQSPRGTLSSRALARTDATIGMPQASAPPSQSSSTGKSNVSGIVASSTSPITASTNVSGIVPSSAPSFADRANASTIAPPPAVPRAGGTGASQPGSNEPPSIVPPTAPASAGSDGTTQSETLRVPVTTSSDYPADGVEQRSGRPDPTSPASREPNTEQHSDTTSGAPDPLARIMPPSKKQPRRPLPFTGLLNGNRDWVLTIECKGDVVILLPSGQRMSIAEFSQTREGSNPLRDSLQQMIARRQASLRVGEPPYRPMIHFRVWPDGVRAYYTAYPVLEPLGLPMARENPEPEEKKER
jgi:hypothetical protein